jgi:hypothetical protein
MPNVEMMEPKSPLKTTGNPLPAKPGQKRQVRERAHDFLNELLAKLPDSSKPRSTDVSEKPEEGNKPLNEFPENTSGEPLTLKDQGKTNNSGDSFQNLLSDTANPPNPVQVTPVGDQEKETNIPVSFSLIDTLDTINLNEGMDTVVTGPFGHSQNCPELGDQPSLLLDQAPTPVGIQAFNEENLALGQGKTREEEGVKKTLAQTIPEEVFEKTSHESPRVEPRLAAQDRPFSEALKPFILREDSQKDFWINREEKDPRVSLFQREIFFEASKGEEGTSFRIGSEISSLFEGKKEANPPLKGEITQGNGNVRNSFPPLDLSNRLSWDSVGPGKNSEDYRPSMGYSIKSSETGFFKDPSFTVITQSRTSMEISLEPAGLGKLDLELNLNHDRLQGQITVQDNTGKELIERNLPQLLSDLAREGLQIGGFTVSLKNQGKGHPPLPVRTEFEEPPLMPLKTEAVGPIQGNHLIHIII